MRRNGVRTLTVRAFADEHHLPSQVLKAAMGKVASLPLPPGYRIEYGGEIENQRETFAEMVHALEISLIAIFLILLFQFRSLSDPLIVMASIPLALPGAALGLFVTRNPFGFTAFMGIVSLGGVVVRNAIILVDYIHARMREGAPLEEAAIEAGERRLRPIFLTTMAAAVGVTPMILSGSSLWSPLASAIAFGLVVSMFFTLVAIPVLFVVVHRRERVRATVPVTAVLGLLLLAVLPAGAAEPRRLTLEEATALAVKQNSTVKLANFKVKEAESRVGAARSNYYPQLRNDSAFVRLGEQQEVDLPRGALGVYPGLGPIPPVTVPFVLAENNLVISSTTVTQPVTHLFKIRDGVRAANAEAGIARSDVRRAEVEIALKVKELYYGILVTGERRRALGLQIAAGEEKLREARDAVETGNALQYKVLEGEAQIAQARQGLQTLDDTLADLALEFDELLGLPLDTQVELVRPEPSSEDAAGGDGLLKTALERNPGDSRGGPDVGEGEGGRLGGAGRVHPGSRRIRTVGLPAGCPAGGAEYRRGGGEDELEHLGLEQAEERRAGAGNATRGGRGEPAPDPQSRADRSREGPAQGPAIGCGGERGTRVGDGAGRGAEGGGGPGGDGHGDRVGAQGGGRRARRGAGGPAAGGIEPAVGGRGAKADCRGAVGRNFQPRMHAN